VRCFFKRTPWRSMTRSDVRKTSLSSRLASSSECSRPSTLTIRSPTRMSASAAGDSAMTERTRTISSAGPSAARLSPEPVNSNGHGEATEHLTADQPRVDVDPISRRVLRVVHDRSLDADRPDLQEASTPDTAT
jgi:hypothetical protein